MIASLEAAFQGSAPVAGSPEFKPTMNVPVGVDNNKNRISDALETGIAARLNNGSGGKHFFHNMRGSVHLGNARVTVFRYLLEGLRGWFSSFAANRL